MNRNSLQSRSTVRLDRGVEGKPLNTRQGLCQLRDWNQRHVGRCEVVSGSEVPTANQLPIDGRTSVHLARTSRRNQGSVKVTRGPADKRGAC
jgi:hypothetical protein